MDANHYAFGHALVDRHIDGDTDAVQYIGAHMDAN